MLVNKKISPQLATIEKIAFVCCCSAIWHRRNNILKKNYGPRLILVPERNGKLERKKEESRETTMLLRIKS